MTSPPFPIVALGFLLGLPGAALAEERPTPQTSGNHEPEIPEQSWSFAPPFGTFDNAQLQRGFQVYRDVCANCHSMNLLSYRNLDEPGGPEFSPKAVEALASQVQVTDGPDEKGQMFQRPARPSDRFRAPFPNEQAARAANNGALPPDLSVIAKARAGGADYLYALLTGYKPAPEGFDLAPGMYYNTAFPGHQIAMPPPLSEDSVAYEDGTAATVEQMSHDVVTFLNWAAEPELEMRKRTGVKVLLFLVVFTGLLYATKRKIWARVH